MKKRTKKPLKVVTYATVVNTCDGIVGSFNTFHKELRDKGFACKRVKITYEVVNETHERNPL